MASPTFNINDLVGQVGRANPVPFAYPSQAQQAELTARKQAARPTVPAPPGSPTSIQQQSMYAT